MPSRHPARTAADLLTATGNASARVIAAPMLAFSDPASALSPWHRAEAQRMASEKLGAASERLVKGLSEAAQENDIPFCGDAVGGMFGFYFSNSIPSTYGQMMAGDKERFNRFFHGMLDEGVYFAPAMFEAGFVSAQHSDAVIDETVEAARRVFKRIG